MVREKDFDPTTISLEAEEGHRANVQSRVEMMRGYVVLGGRRRHYLLNYFGGEYPRVR